MAVGHHPFGVTLHGEPAFVTEVLSDTVGVIDLATARVIARLPTGARRYAIAFAAGKGFVTNRYGASLSVFDAESFVPLGEIATDDAPLTTTPRALPSLRMAPKFWGRTGFRTAFR